MLRTAVGWYIFPQLHRELMRDAKALHMCLQGQPLYGADSKEETDHCPPA